MQEASKPTMMPAAIDMPPLPAERAGMREVLEEEDNCPRVDHDVFYSQPRALRCSGAFHSRRNQTQQTETMPFDKSLRNLLEQPFGPYLEETVLSDKCKFTASKPLLLVDFQLAYNNEPTG